MNPWGSGVSAERRSSWQQPASGALPRRHYRETAFMGWLSAARDRVREAPAPDIHWNLLLATTPSANYSWRSFLVPLEFLQQLVGALCVFVSRVHGTNQFAFHRHYRIVDREALLQGNVLAAAVNLQCPDSFLVLAFAHGFRGQVRIVFALRRGAHEGLPQLRGGFVWIAGRRLAGAIAGFAAALQKNNCGPQDKSGGSCAQQRIL